ncbi:MAG: hypothetical protein AMJ54_15465 [Deltaproteobacteria bacterium SG8_13]|nr:MAG: hypothetical protein AMJ54_15465 [Deltaproteobacteria bacterium SG8_13]
MTPSSHSKRIREKPRPLKSLLKAMSILAICTLLVYVPAATVAYISDRQTTGDRYAAILISAHALAGNDHWLPPIALLGSYPAWTLYFNTRGLKPVYFLSATYQDFVTVLQDERYQSVVLVGHGSYNHWRATDQEVSVFDVERLKGTFSKKSGEWFQLTCGTRELSDVQLGEPVMTSGRSHAYSGNAYALQFVIDALTPFRIIKSATEKRYRKPGS